MASRCRSDPIMAARSSSRIIRSWGSIRGGCATATPTIGSRTSPLRAINQAHCIRNPEKFDGYSAECWGLTASDSIDGYVAHAPDRDCGVISPTGALASFPYAPAECKRALRHFASRGERLWGEYGFRDAFSPAMDWYADSYLAIDQGPIVVMIENYRSGLLWRLFMSCPETGSASRSSAFLSRRKLLLQRHDKVM